MCGAAGGFPREPQPGTTTWGYIEAVDGQAVTLDDGTVLRLTEKSEIVKTDGTAGALVDVVKNLKAVADIAQDGTVGRMELLRRPSWQETYLATMGTAGANITSAIVKGRTYPRSLALLRGSFAYRSQYTRASLEGDVTYQPEKGATAPPGVRFVILGAAGEVCFDRSVAADEVAHFRINWGQGDRSFTLLATPEGPGALRPEWCLWLDPRFASGPTPPPGGLFIHQRTTRELLGQLAEALGERKVEKLAISQLGNVRVTDSGLLAVLQEDLVVLGAHTFDVVGKYDTRVDLGSPLTDAQKQQLEKLGAKYLLVGTVSDRGNLIVVSAAVVSVETNEIVATARAVQ
jgi:hypothetical protein